MQSIHLTQAERTVFDTLPAPLREGWDVKAEEGTVYETDYELMVRANMAEVDGFPQLKQMMLDLRAGKTIDPSTIGEIPENLIPEVLYSIGARGISIIMEELLKRAKTDQELLSLAAFSQFRHDILDVNASVRAN